MRTLPLLMAGACALAVTAGQPNREVTTPAPLQVADMDMGPNGPELGGSSDDMVLTNPGYEPAPASDMNVVDPGHVPSQPNMVTDDPGTLPAAPNMITSDPGFVPAPAQMDVGTPADDDTQDDIIP
ncbi:MAG: hypothetical protein FJ148_11525 [Deltaproteobacteria bacterium]|nr:hypothetical protein [Deltaproteobacteria bacterium]